MIRHAPLIIVIAAGCIRTNAPSAKPEALGTSVAAQPLPASTHDALPLADLSAVLTSGKWIKDLGSGPWHEQYVYTFAEVGTYTSKLITDHTTPTLKGRWELVDGNDGKVHLRLSEHEGKDKYYWLGQDSVIRHDNEKDELVVSGERYAGEPRLRHEIP